MKSAPQQLAVLLALTMGWAGSGAGEWVWHPDTDWIDPEAQAKNTADARYGRAVALMADGQFASARNVFREIERNFPAAPILPRVRQRMAECLFSLGHYAKAFREAALLLSADQAVVPRAEVQRLQFACASAMAREDWDEAPVRLREIIEKCPNAGFIPEARAALGDFYFARGLDSLARQEYALLLAEHAGSPAAAEARFKKGQSDLRQSRDVAHDPPALARAQEAFVRYRKDYPKGPRAEQAKEYVWVIRNLLAEPDRGRRGVFYAVTHVIEKEYKRPYRTLKRLARKHKDTFAGETARYYQAECLYQRGKHAKALKVYEQLIKDCPTTKRLARVVEREYGLGRELMKRKPRLAIFAFEKVIDHNPGGPRADDAERHLGDLYLERGAFGDARVSYRSILENRPGSSWVPFAKYKLGVCALREAEMYDGRLDQLRTAQARFSQYLRDHPDGAFAVHARAGRRRAYELDARYHFAVAQFYRRRKRPESAVRYFRLVAARFPRTSWSKKAERLLALFGERGFGDTEG